MVEFIGKYYVKKKGAEDNQLKKRQIYGTVSSVIGIMLNVCLFLGKYIAGVISGSIAIMADAVNNLSDAGSSFITLIGFRFAGKKPDVDHPFGHGRFEYISGFVVSMAIIMMVSSPVLFCHCHAESTNRDRKFIRTGMELCYSNNNRAR